MLHQYFKDILYPESPDYRLNATNGKGRSRFEENGVLEKDDSYRMWTELEESFIQSAHCEKCTLRGNLKDFSKWKSTEFTERISRQEIGRLILREIVKCVPVWRAIRFESCLCPFSFGYWGLEWIPSCPEATAMLMAQSCDFGTDVILKLSNSSLGFNCHSFLLQKLNERIEHQRGFSSASYARLIIEPRGHIIIELDYRYYSIETLQFIFYSAYGHTFHLQLEQVNRQAFTIIQSLLQHLVNFSASICKYLIDIPATITNLIIVLEDLISDLDLTVPSHLIWISDLLSILRLSVVLKDLEEKLIVKLTTCIQELSKKSDTRSISVLSRIHSCAKHCHETCFVLNLVHKLLIPVFTQEPKAFDQFRTEKSTKKPNISEILDDTEVIKNYITHISKLHDNNPFHCFVRLIRDAKIISCILIMTESPCSDDMKNLRLNMINALLLILSLISDDLALNVGRVILHNYFRNYPKWKQSYMNLLTSIASSSNEFWAYAFARNSEGETESFIVFFQKFVDRMIAITAQFQSKFHAYKELETMRFIAFISQKLFIDIPIQDCERIMNCITTVEPTFHRMTDCLLGAAFRELRSVAYASYSTVKVPKMKTLVQYVALVFGKAVCTETTEKDRIVQFNLSAEGRKILCTDGAINHGLKELNVAHILVRPDCETLLKKIEDEKVDSKCMPGRVLKRMESNDCADHNELNAACILWNWLVALVDYIRCLQHHFKAHRSTGDFFNHMKRFVSLNSDLFYLQWTELWEDGEINNIEYTRLKRLLLQTNSEKIQKKPKYSRLPEYSDFNDSQFEAANTMKPKPTVFRIQFTVQLVFQFNPTTYVTTG